jgi:hypothetical protein
MRKIYSIFRTVKGIRERANERGERSEPPKGEPEVPERTKE